MSSRQSQERSGTFISLVRAQLRDLSTPRTQSQEPAPATGPLARPGSGPLRPGLYKVNWQPALSAQSPAEAGQDALLQLTRGDLEKRLASTNETVERASMALGRLSESLSGARVPGADVGKKATQAQYQELGILEQLLRKLTRELRQTQLNATNNFARLDAALTSREQGSLESAESVSEARYQEFVRQAGSFAVEINSLARRLAAIIQEMRTGLGPFQLEGGTSTNPGTQFEAEQFSSPSSVANW
ncbi:MAG TPA: hypothetical protein VF458_15765 [Ktedonobacteraceae bacterium]